MANIFTPYFYLVAHAPEQPWDSFEPDLTRLGPKPKLPSREDPQWRFTVEQRSEIYAYLASESPLPDFAKDFGAAHVAAHRAIEQWETKAEQLRLVQWLWWWAKKVLDEQPPGTRTY